MEYQGNMYTGSKELGVRISYKYEDDNLPPESILLEVLVQDTIAGDVYPVTKAIARYFETGRTYVWLREPLEQPDLKDVWSANG